MFQLASEGRREVTMNEVDEDQKINEEEVGLDPAIPDPNDQPSFDPAKIDMVTQNRTIDALLQRLKFGEMDLLPDFQRNPNLWGADRKTSLIESLLLRIPIPSLYVSEDEEGNYVVVDGLQRMSAIAHFVDVDSLNEAIGAELKPLTLNEKGLRSFKELSGLTFKELDRPLQRRINETELTIHIIRSGTPSEVKFNIFSRINQGGLSLTAQEIRNAVYPGKWQNKIKEIADSEHFLKATEGKIPTNRMQDLELVLRAVAMHEQCDLRPNDQNLEDYLNEFVSQRCQHWDDEKWEATQARITNALIVAPVIFGEYVFRKIYLPTDQRKPINVGLFESQIGLLSRYSKAQLELLISRFENVKELYVKVSDSVAYKEIYQATKQDVNTEQLLANVSSILDEFSKSAMSVELTELDLDLSVARINLIEGTTTATSKGKASNQRVEAIQYIYDQVLTDKKDN